MFIRRGVIKIWPSYEPLSENNTLQCYYNSPQQAINTYTIQAMAECNYGIKLNTLA